MIQKQLQIQVPKLSEFKLIGEGKRVLPYAVRETDGSTYEAPYLQGIAYLQQVQKAHPDYKLFIPNSPDIHALFKILLPEERFWTSTGTIVLRKDERGYVDKRFTDLDGKRVELRHTSIAEHGISWRAKDENQGIITDSSKLKEYTEIDAIKKPGVYRVAGYDEERGVVTKFNPSEKPVSDYNNAPAWVNPILTFASLGRGYWDLDGREWLFGSDLDGGAEDPDWRFPLGSVATAGSKQILCERFAELRAKLDAIPNQRISELPTYVRDLSEELDRLTRELHSE